MLKSKKNSYAALDLQLIWSNIFTDKRNRARPDIQHTRGHHYNYVLCDCSVLCRMLIQLQHRFEKVLRKVKRFLVTMVTSGRRYSDVWKTLSVQMKSLLRVLDAVFRTDIVLFVLSSGWSECEEIWQAAELWPVCTPVLANRACC